MIYFSSALVSARISKQYPFNAVSTNMLLSSHPWRGHSHDTYPVSDGCLPNIITMKTQAYHKAIYSIFLFQGAYFVITGIWPILNMESFVMATGPKLETWLVKMVGLLATSIGLTFLVSALRKRSLPMLLAYAASSSFLIMDIIYVANQTIRRIYLLDAAIQFAFLASMTFFIIRKQQRTSR